LAEQHVEIAATTELGGVLQAHIDGTTGSRTLANISSSDYAAFPSDKQGAFEPEATAAMGEAFDAACKELYCTGQPEVVRELIAALIVAAASRGELDPIRLRTVALAGFTMDQRYSPCNAPNARANLVAARIIFDPVGSTLARNP
jgi:hypothetical protein